MRIGKVQSGRRPDTALPKAEGPLYLSATGVDVQTARPGRRSRAGVVGPRSVRGATRGVSLDAERVRDTDPSSERLLKLQVE